MANNMKVRGGTSIGGENLCRTCAHSTIIQGHAVSEEIVRCNEVGEFIRFPVADCNEYRNRNQVTLNTMKEVAWILVPKKGDGLGFVTQATFSQMKKQGQIDDDKYTKDGRWRDEYDD